MSAEGRCDVCIREFFVWPSKLIGLASFSFYPCAIYPCEKGSLRSDPILTRINSTRIKLLDEGPEDSRNLKTHSL